MVLGNAEAEAATADVVGRQVDITWRTGSHGYHVVLRLAGPQAQQPQLKVERDRRTLMDKGDLSVSSDVAG